MIAHILGQQFITNENNEHKPTKKTKARINNENQLKVDGMK